MERGLPVPRSPGARGFVAVAALAAILAVTAAWWALALWPLPEASPPWLVRTRAICFGSAENGLPDAAGWTALILQPAAMLGTLLVGWGRELAAGLRALFLRPGGRFALGTGTVLLALGVVAAGYRVARATAGEGGAFGGGVAAWADAGDVPDTYPRLDRPAPALDGLVDQRGEPADLGRFRGRTVLVAFAYAHCSTVCPLIVKDVLGAQGLARERGGGAAPAVLVVTLDPWRDTPARLAAIAESWGMGADAFVVSGPPETLTETLARWNVAWSRDPNTGEITHAPLVYVVDGDGVIRYAARGNARVIAELAARTTAD